MLTDLFFSNIKEILNRIEITQKGNIKKCADIIVESLCNDGVWHLLDTGHMLMYEGVGRTGGMMAVRPIVVKVEVNNPTRQRFLVEKKSVYLDEIEGFSKFVLGKSNIVPGDVLMIGSVSGKNVLPVEISLQAREMGVNTIAITSVAYSKFLEPEHPSGKKLFEVCDCVIDNCGDIGDTLIYVEEIQKGICPSSGIAASCIMWAIQAKVVELLISMGKSPSIYINNHLRDARKNNKYSWLQYEQQGF